MGLIKFFLGEGGAKCHLEDWPRAFVGCPSVMTYESWDGTNQFIEAVKGKVAMESFQIIHQDLKIPWSFCIHLAVGLALKVSNVELFARTQTPQKQWLQEEGNNMERLSDRNWCNLKVLNSILVSTSICDPFHSRVPILRTSKAHEIITLFLLRLLLEYFCQNKSCIAIITLHFRHSRIIIQ